MVTAAVPEQGSVVQLLGSCVNQDGRTSSLTAPNGPSQQAAIRGALQAACIQPAQVSSLELHGTGTPLGDPIEVGAVLAVLRGGVRPLCLSAAKTRMGHSEPVSGAVGVLHMATMLSGNASSAILHLRQLNPMVTPLLGMVEGHLSRLPRQATPYVSMHMGPAGSRSTDIGAVSAFAFQGTNAHAVLRSGSSQQPAESSKRQLPWKRRRHWFAPRALVLARSVGKIGHGSESLQMCISLENTATSFLWDHQVQGRPILPAAAMLEAAYAAASMLHDPSKAATGLGAGQCSSLVQVSIPASLDLNPIAELGATLNVYEGVAVLSSSQRGSTRRHLVSNLARPWNGPSGARVAAPPAPQARLAAGGEEKTARGSALADMARADRCGQPEQYHAHPAAIDSTTQLGSALVPSREFGQPRPVRLPVGLEAYSPAAARAEATLHASSWLLGTAAGSNVDLSYRLGQATTACPSHLHLHIMRFKLVRAATSTQQASGADSGQSEARLHIMQLQCAGKVEQHSTAACLENLACSPAGAVHWQLGANGPNLVIGRGPSSRSSLHTSQASLEVLQAAVHLPAILRTPVAVPGVSMGGTACAGACALLRVAVQERLIWKSAHIMRDAGSCFVSAGPGSGGHLNEGLLVGNGPLGLMGTFEMSGQGPTCDPALLVAAPSPETVAVRIFGGAVLVTGGMGAVAQLAAAWLVQQHASSGSAHPTRLWLLGRRGRPVVSGQFRLSAGSLHFGYVTTGSCDISVSSDVDALARAVRAGSEPLVAVLHAAGVLQDALLSGQTSESLRAVHTPKVVGFLRLAATTTADPLSRSMQFSSLAAQLGTPGQGNYVAANLALDTLAQLQYHAGLPFTSVMWGPWAAGMAASLPKSALALFVQAGLSLLAPDDGLSLLEAAISDAIPPAASFLAARLGVSSLSSTPADGPPHSQAQSVKQPSRGAVETALLVQDAVHRMLGSAVTQDQPLMDAGLDSIGNSQA